MPIWQATEGLHALFVADPDVREAKITADNEVTVEYRSGWRQTYHLDPPVAPRGAGVTRRYEVTIDSDHDDDVTRAAMAWLADELTKRLRGSQSDAQVVVQQIGL